MRYDAKWFHLDKKSRMFYVEDPFNPADLPGLVAQYREALTQAPNDHGTRLMLANCLYASGQREEAQAEWQTILDSGDKQWISMVQRTQALIRRNQPPTSDEPDEPQE